MPRLELTGSVYRGQIGAIIAAAEWIGLPSNRTSLPSAFILRAFVVNKLCAVNWTIKLRALIILRSIYPSHEKICYFFLFERMNFLKRFPFKGSSFCLGQKLDEFEKFNY